MRKKFSFFKGDIVKEESRQMYNLCLKRAESIGRAAFIRSEGRIDLTEMYKDDMLRFLVYIVCADGDISPEEIEYVNSLTGSCFTLALMGQYADGLELRSEKILENPPMSLEAFVRSNIGPETGEVSNGYYDLLGDIEASKQKGEPYKIMFVGINGTGKTTTIAKMATYLEKHGYSSVFGASDTFRAGAIEQLEHHAKNLNLKIIKHERNSDPAAVAYDAVEHARATGKDVVLIDTSGRMQTNTNLMDEMKKIKRVSQPDIVLYVGDALMGNDATEQASKFNEVINIDGIILTKADADAKGGAAISIGHVINKPILFIGTGQSYDDLMEFEPEWMIKQIFEEE